MTYPEFHTKAFLTEDERQCASSLPAAARQAMIKNVLYPYDKFVEISQKIMKFHRPVDGGEPDTGWIAGLLGEYRSGKTFILQNFARQFPPRLTDNGFEYDVVYIQARQDWDSLELGKQIYMMTGVPAVPRLTIASMNSKAARRLIECKTKLLIIDDAHCLFGAAGKRRTVYASLIKYLVDQANACNVLLAGPSTIEAPMEGDLQMKGRGGFPRFKIEGFDPLTAEGRNRFRLFLHGVDERLPFRQPSQLASKRYLPDLLEMTDGSLGLAMNIIIAAGYDAINDGAACIMPHHLRAASEDRLPSGKTFTPFAGVEA